MVTFKCKEMCLSFLSLNCTPSGCVRPDLSGALSFLLKMSAAYWLITLGLTLGGCKGRFRRRTFSNIAAFMRGWSWQRVSVLSSWGRFVLLANINFDYNRAFAIDTSREAGLFVSGTAFEAVKDNQAFDRLF